MSKGDINKFSIPTTYRGIDMRSKLETKIALFLDYLKIEWEYEPKTFLLSTGIMYKPDFYLPEHKQWIEVKGVIGDNNFKISETFVKETKQELILISSNDIYYFHRDYDDSECCMEKGMQIGFCSNCKTNFFTPVYASFYCRKCGSHNGDHNIYAILNSDIYWDKIDFSNLEEIKLWLKDNARKI